eukprot:TRINITY_DN1555_c0_g1_i1.p2 TRINITY_DN1555_c0_g1~~TRINITY_DN1555_c0_g1_i1.p2  ORF type:complete len:112 (+),score=24.84 TRINITY_DN1555_c0_g1_i1:511-846(+)
MFPLMNKKLQDSGLNIYLISRVTYTGEFFLAQGNRGVWLKAYMPKSGCEIKWTLFHHNAWAKTVPSDAKNFHPWCEGPMKFLENGMGISLETSVWGDDNKKEKVPTAWPLV